MPVRDRRARRVPQEEATRARISPEDTPGTESGSPEQPRILVIDDEESTLYLLRKFLASQGYSVEITPSGLEAVELVRQAGFDILLLDLRMPQIGGLDTLREIRRYDEAVSILIMTAFGSIKDAVEAVKLGADDFLLKPLSLEALGLCIRRILEYRALKAECALLREQVSLQEESGNLLTRNRQLAGILDLIRKVAPLRSTVLIQGESGTGKELLARTIHTISPRADRRFVALNCGVIPVNLLESELFGYEKGAFTGADSRKPGYFDAANGGTIFLDEISEMPMDLQVKLLRVIQERRFQRIGGTDEIATNVRIIASTNRNLDEEVAQNRFRRDLYYRINVIKVTMPPLRERSEDIALLSFHFLHKYNREFEKSVRGICPQVMELFLHSRWDGNVRELENAIEYAVAVCEGPEITLRDLPIDLRGEPAIMRIAPELKPYTVAKEAFEVEYLKRLLRKSGGNISQAARMASIPRQNLYEKLKKYSLEPEPFR
jgi:DNA-binding NtrC family response regulator